MVNFNPKVLLDSDSVELFNEFGFKISFIKLTKKNVALVFEEIKDK